MASWVEDTVQAFTNLGGKAYWLDVFNEVVRIRHELPTSDSKITFHKTLWKFSSASSADQGEVLFSYEGNGVWALKAKARMTEFDDKKQQSTPIKNASETSDWHEDTLQALKNLGGKAHQKKIIEEVARIRKDPLLNRVKLMVLNMLQSCLSESSDFPEKNQCKYVGNGEWQLKYVKRETKPSQKNDFEISDLQVIKKILPEESIQKELEVLPRTEIKVLPVNTVYKTPHTSIPTGFVTEKSDLIVDKKPENKPLSTIQPDLIIRNVNPIPPSFAPRESSEEIANYLRTIKQYRDYQDPSLSSWEEYVEEIFHILGFSTDQMESRLLTLKVMGTNQSPVAIVGSIRPGEDLEKTAHGQYWMSYLLSSAKHQIPWGILTDGISIKVFQIQNQVINIAVDWQNLDEIINHEWLDSFSKIFRIIAFLKENDHQPSAKIKQNQPETQESGAELRKKFWEQVVEKGRKRRIIASKRQSNTYNWMSIPSGKTGYLYALVIARNEADVEFYIDKADFYKNKQFFDSLFLQKSEIENKLKRELDWQRLDTRRACRIRYVYRDVSIFDVEEWDTLQDQMLDLVIEFKKVFTPYIEANERRR